MITLETLDLPDLIKDKVAFEDDLLIVDCRDRAELNRIKVATYPQLYNSGLPFQKVRYQCPGWRETMHIIVLEGALG